MTLEERINLALEDAGKTQADLHRDTGVSRASISDWCSGSTKSIKSNFVFDVARALGVNAEWLANNNGPMYPHVDYARIDSPHGVKEAEAAKYAWSNNVSPIRSNPVPLLRWEDLAREVLEIKAIKSDHWMPCPVDHSDETFALQVEGDSMTSPYAGQKSYPAGTYIFIDPKITAKPGTKVLAKTASGSILFRNYSSESGSRYLTASNPQFPAYTMTERDTILGTVIGSFTPE